MLSLHAFCLFHWVGIRDYSGGHWVPVLWQNSILFYRLGFSKAVFPGKCPQGSLSFPKVKVIQAALLTEGRRPSVVGPLAGDQEHVLERLTSDPGVLFIQDKAHLSARLESHVHLETSVDQKSGSLPSWVLDWGPFKCPGGSLPVVSVQSSTNG